MKVIGLPEYTTTFFSDQKSSKLSKYYIKLKKTKQAWAELGQAQPELGLKNLLRLMFEYEECS